MPPPFVAVRLHALRAPTPPCVVVVADLQRPLFTLYDSKDKTNKIAQVTCARVDAQVQVEGDPLPDCFPHSS